MTHFPLAFPLAVMLGFPCSISVQHTKLSFIALLSACSHADRRQQSARAHA
jgi:hypothetical protein